MGRKEDKISRGEALTALQNIVDRASSTYPDSKETRTALYWNLIANEVGRFRGSSDQAHNNALLREAEDKFLYQNFGYLLHPDFPRLVREASVPYAQFLLVLSEVLLRGSNPKSLEEGIKKLTSLDTDVIEYFQDPLSDIADQFKAAALLRIDEDAPATTNLGLAIKDVDLLIKLVKPAHVLFRTSLLFEDTFDSIEKITDILFFGSPDDPSAIDKGSLDSYPSRQEVDFNENYEDPGIFEMLTGTPVEGAPASAAVVIGDRFLRDDIPLIIAEPFIRREGYPFILSVSHLNYDLNFLTGDQLAPVPGKATEGDLAGLAFNTDFTATATMTSFPSADTPVWVFSGSLLESHLVLGPGYGEEIVPASGGTGIWTRTMTIPVTGFLMVTEFTLGPTAGLAVSPLADFVNVGLSITYQNPDTEIDTAFGTDGIWVRDNQPVGNPNAFKQIYSNLVPGVRYHYAVSVDGTNVRNFINGIELDPPVPYAQFSSTINRVRFGRIFNTTRATDIRWHYVAYIEGIPGIFLTDDNLGG